MLEHGMTEGQPQAIDVKSILPQLALAERSALFPGQEVWYLESVPRSCVPSVGAHAALSHARHGLASRRRNTVSDVRALGSLDSVGHPF